jgi:DNA-binding NtrC family response regulator
MQQAINTIKKVAATDANLLLLGENGTGKCNGRIYPSKLQKKNEPFVHIDLGSISENFSKQNFSVMQKVLLPMPKQTKLEKLKMLMEEPFS